MSSRASAAEPGVKNRVKGKLRFHVDTDFFGWKQGRAFTDDSNQNPPKSNQIGFGFARPLAGEADIRGLNLATGSSMFGLGLGYGISRHLILGARLGLSFDHRFNSSEGPVKGTNNYFSSIFTPYLEIVLLPEGRILPFILVRGGFQAATAARRATLIDPSVGNLTNLDRTSLIAPTIGGGGGAHFLITERFSLDASLMFDYRWSYSRERTADANRPTITTDWKKTYQSFSLGAVIGFSVWFR